MKALALVKMMGGSPDVDWNLYPVHGYVLGAIIPNSNWGAYIVSGTGAQLTALDTSPDVVGIAAIDEKGTGLRWSQQIDNTIPAGVRNRINTWISNNYPNAPTVPAGATYRQVVLGIFKRANVHFDIDSFDIQDSP